MTATTLPVILQSIPELKFTASIGDEIYQMVAEQNYMALLILDCWSSTGFVFTKSSHLFDSSILSTEFIMRTLAGEKTVRTKG